ncbi:MAG: hypothetical protein K6T55_10480 [Syntrophobacterales bacterium]|nr:hypothetical protein [Syntrophobacterales bacterium]
MDEMTHTREAVEQARAALKAEADELVRVSRRLNENLVEAVRRIWRQLLLIWTVLAVLALTYFLVMVYVPPAVRQPGASAGSALEAPVRSLSPDTFPEFPERGELARLLDRIREAQYAKDPELFFSAYSPTLPDLARKREVMVALWQRYDYLDMHYHVRDLKTVSEGVVRGAVTWNFTTRDRATQAVKSHIKTYQVQFTKASGQWLIQELETFSDPGAGRPRPN